MASSTDTIGPITRSVGDTAVVLDVLAGRDASDGTSIERDAQGYLMIADSKPKLTGVTFGLIEQYLGHGLHPEVAAGIEQSVAALQAAGATVKRVSLPAVERAQ